MNTTWKVTRNNSRRAVRPDAVDFIIAEVGRQSGIDQADLDALVRPEPEKARAGSSYPVFQAAVTQIAAGPNEDLLRGARRDRGHQQNVRDADLRLRRGVLATSFSMPLAFE